ncbi:dienelactone hydrolase family protein [Fluoribacter gormanii]|uniref:Alpha/beta hydrolase family n=1 Tax=Fluoribacter gormanii TaxID=464 RepID=A0A377GGR2_9GAMM|nr:alpha/beta hydrolase [Fluoribacter gormanii]KTD02271.1 dienelactone hydrolase family protein [Fluoribacter gormanii]SIR27332.1 Dienelactone hydrolase [Fluoribacter gormanii]STO24020.1 Alpha/beta hydrolase family [Fluoribacter gormanii]
MNAYTADIQHPVTIPSKNVYLNGFLFIPEEAKGMVIFVHGSGSSRFSSRNQYVASTLNEGKYATLLFDLLTSQEDVIDNVTREFRFDIHLLASRLLDVIQWCTKEFSAYHFPIGLFGASTGGGAALVAAAQAPNFVQAIVSRGGRPDLAGNYLPKVKSPTLLIVGGDDDVVIGLNQQAMSQMSCIIQLELVPGATHLFEEPGTLQEVSNLAKKWFDQYCTR